MENGSITLLQLQLLHIFLLCRKMLNLLKLSSYLPTLMFLFLLSQLRTTTTKNLLLNPVNSKFSLSGKVNSLLEINLEMSQKMYAMIKTCLNTLHLHVRKTQIKTNVLKLARKILIKPSAHVLNGEIKQEQMGLRKLDVQHHQHLTQHQILQ